MQEMDQQQGDVDVTESNPEETSAVAAQEVAEPEEKPEEEVKPEPAGETVEPAEENEQSLTDAEGKAGQEAEEAVAAATTDDVLAAVEGLSEQIEKMNDLFTNRISYTEYEQDLTKSMNDELQRLRNDLYAQLLRPILLEVIDVRDSILRMSKYYASLPEGEQSIPLRTFRGYSCDLEDILENNNVVITDSKEGDAFNPRVQRVIEKVPTPDESLNGKIAGSQSSGYEYKGSTISPEKVNVYVYQKQEETEGEN